MRSVLPAIAGSRANLPTQREYDKMSAVGAPAPDGTKSRSVKPVPSISGTPRTWKNLELTPLINTSAGLPSLPINVASSGWAETPAAPSTGMPG